MKKKGLKILAEVARRAAKRAGGRASEYGICQPKRPEKKEN